MGCHSSSVLSYVCCLMGVADVCFGGCGLEKKGLFFCFDCFSGRWRGIECVCPLHLVVFWKNVVCQNVPEVGFDAARWCQEGDFVVSNNARKDVFLLFLFLSFDVCKSLCDCKICFCQGINKIYGEGIKRINLAK